MKKSLIASGVAILAFASIAAAQGYMFNTNLTVGSTGSDVVALQTALMNAGYSIPAITAGTPKGYFGSQTQAAVMAYQAARGIPNTGFVGPLTRGALNGGTTVVTPGVVTCPVGMICTPIGGGNTTTGNVTGTLQGGEGQLTDFDTLGSISSESVDEGESDAKVLGVEFEAEDSDLKVERVDVDFTAPASGSDALEDYIDSVSLWWGTTRLGSLDVDEADDSDNDVFSFRFTGLNGVIREGDTANLYVAVDAVNNVDSDDTGSWTVEIPQDGIRAVDAAGISDTYVGSSDNLQEDFTVGDSNSGELDVTEASSNPVAGIVTVSDDNDTTDVTLLVIDLEADESDITIDEMPFSLVSVGANVDEIVKSVRLMNGSTVLDSKSIPTTATTSYHVIFDNLDFTIEDGDTETLKIVVDVNDVDGTLFTEGDSLYATTTGSSVGWDVEDANNDTVTPDGTVTGDAQSFYLDGIIVKLSGTPTATDSNGLATFNIPFTVKANGSDIYVNDGGPDKILAAATPSGVDLGVQYSTSTAASGTGAVSRADLESSVNSGDSAGEYFKVLKGETRSFNLVVEMTNVATATFASDAIGLRSINWSTTTADASFVNHYTYDLGAFITPTRTWRTTP